MMNVIFKLEVLKSILKLHFQRKAFERNPKKHQQKMWRKFQSTVLTISPFYQSYLKKELADFPVLEKKEFIGNFNEINTKGVDLKQAIDVATRSENSRDFSPTLNGFTVGLSTGTSGNKGLFLVSKKERAMWVALILQRIIGWKFRKRKIAFFLRANSNLYTSVQSKLLAFNFFDLLDPIDEHLSRIDKLQPNIIVGQPSLLILLAKAQKNEVIKLCPNQIISVAEVLSPIDQETIEGVFQVHVQQVYQCSEGMFGQSCKKGNIHLNEDGLIIEKQWIDEKRFVPIITDLRRNVQPIIRYKMNDILHTTDCSCGSKMLAVSTIEGRMDDLLTFKDKVIFPDFIRRAITGANSEIDNYQLIRVSDQKLNLFVSPTKHWDKAKVSVIQALSKQGVTNIEINKIINIRHEKGSKFRRIHAKYN
jgi:putative adenylate-forming enzyme